MNLPKTYTPDSYEPTIYALWESSGAFSPSGKGEPYSIVMPPPNANGNLHVGHALMSAVEDILVRFYRMQGRDTIYIPGADHAGFETWVVYERELESQGKSRFDFSREQLYSQVWNFVEKQRGTMELQLRALGASADWKSQVFTLDEKVIKTTYATFKKLWDEELIYRGERIVNYCTVHQTGFADIEVEHKNEKGSLWNIAYPSTDGAGEIIVATTRPETMLGDVAVAVHPDDARYKEFIGKTVTLPLVDKEIPVIADSYVDQKYGTGAVKITPAHDPNDFDIGERHDLASLRVIDFNGKMINVPSQFLGLSASEARKRVLAALEAQDLRRGESEIEHAVAHCYKCHSVIEPMLKEQWFIKMAPLTKAAIETLDSEKITFYPESKKRVLIQYLENLKDWNLSRQIPWGIPIPAFQSTQDPQKWIFNEEVDKPSITIDGTEYKREEDTFDTWFSSGQWPYIVTDALDKNSELSRFYPNSVMETGHDILYPWVSRMIMLGLKITDEIPFKDVYLHGLVLDEHGQKMSKSKGNVINPMELLAEYGSDALRLGLVSSRSAGQNQAFTVAKVIAGRNFCNKLWNVARFIEDKLPDGYERKDPVPESLADHWIIREMGSAAQELKSLVENYRLSEAAEMVYHTLWSTLADWYIESSKSSLNEDVLAWALDTTLRMTHPFAPFVSETIWQTVPWYTGLLISESWPQAVQYNEIAAEEFTRLIDLVSEIRFIMSELPNKRKYSVLFGEDSLIEDNQALITSLTGVSHLEKTSQPRGLRLANSGREAWLDVDKKTIYEHQSNLEVRLVETRESQAMLKKRLDNPTYIEKAPPALVEESRKQLDELTQRVEKLKAELEVITQE